MVFRNFFTSYVLPDLIPTSGKTRNMGVSGHFGLGRPLALEKSRARAEDRKARFPGARDPGMKKKYYHAIRDGCPHFLYSLRFARPDPHGRKPQNTGMVGHFSLGQPLALKEIPGPDQKRRNTISRCSGSQNEKRSPRYPGWFSVWTSRFGRPDLHGWEIASYGGFWPFLPGTAHGT